jgi:hypothetical protein
MWGVRYRYAQSILVQVKKKKKKMNADNDEVVMLQDPWVTRVSAVRQGTTRQQTKREQ